MNLRNATGRDGCRDHVRVSLKKPRVWIAAALTLPSKVWSTLLGVAGLYRERIIIALQLHQVDKPLTLYVKPHQKSLNGVRDPSVVGLAIRATLVGLVTRQITVRFLEASDGGHPLGL